MEKRRSQRMDALATMKGKLFNVVNFMVVNISQDGLHLVSSFQPIIGASYKIFLFNTNAASQQDFEIEINRAQVEPYNPERFAALSPGLLYAIGAKFINQNKKRQEFLTFFLQNKSIGPEQGFIAKDKIKPHR
ncbi:MAG TPA: hypothetical protein VLQ89_06485 [Candidatus Binatia bacterium]|nr:hypothetical protein [Candidatus Binatia bacterium]